MSAGRLMTFLPIVARELLVRSRDKNTWRIRAFAAGAAFLIGVPLLFFAQPTGRPGMAGQQFFYVLAGLTLLFCIFEGGRHTSDSISRERREGTLGLLFLTDLKGYDIVLGKLAVSSINSLFGLLAVFPILSLGLLAGGITAGEFWRMSLALTVALIFSMAAGTWISARGADEGRTVLATTLLLGGVVGGLPVLDSVLGFGAQQPVFSLASPVTGCFMSTDWAWRTGPHRFWLSQATCLLAALGLFAHAALTLTPAIAAHSLSGSPRKRPQSRNRCDLDRDPIAWLASENTVLPRAIMGLIIVSGLLTAFQLYEALSKPAGPGLVVTQEVWIVSIVVGMLTWFLVAYLVSDFFLQIRRTGLFELLLSTPLSSAALVQGHQRAIWRTLRGPAALWLGISALGFLPTAVRLSQAGVTDAVVEMLFAHVINMSQIVLTLIALTYAGAWFAVNSRNSVHALAKTVSLVLVLPFVMGTIATPLFMFGAWSPFGFRVAQPITVLLCDVFFIAWAGKRLKTEFRQAAVRHITGDRPIRPLDGPNPAGEYFGLLSEPR